MKLFKCQSCGNAIYFENAACVVCRHRLGFAPDLGVMSALTPEAEGGSAQVLAKVSALADPSRGYRICENADACGCNWLVAVEDQNPFCLCCRHNRTVPNLTDPHNREAWAKIEKAKRQLFYSLLRWRLPVPTRSEDSARGLVFDLLADGAQKVLTGHEEGLITLNIAEADDAERESRRIAMAEPYRTLLGHLRHEIGHYFWDRLVRDEGRQSPSGFYSAMKGRTTTPRCNGITPVARRPTGPTPSSAPMRRAIPSRISRKPGRITCISSIRWKRPTPSASRSDRKTQKTIICGSTWFSTLIATAP